MECAWIKQYSIDFPVNRLCGLVDVSRGTYYEWPHHSPTTQEKDDRALTTIIVSAFKESRATYGTRRLKEVLFKQHQTASRRRIGRLMRNAKLACKTRRRVKATTNSKHNLPIAENHLDRQFAVQRPDQVYAGDIAYIHTQEGWLYLAVVVDLFSRQIVGWSMAEHMRAKLVKDAPPMAVWKRKPAKGLLWHADRGSQYASESHRELLRRYGIRQSMGRKGNCWDNAVPESFLHTLKTELVHHQRFRVGVKPGRLYLNIWRYFITGNGHILPMAICHRLITNCSRWLLKHVSGKVLTHQLMD